MADPRAAAKPVKRVRNDKRGVSLYVRLAHSLRGGIMQGDWKPGEQLPTIPDLMRQFGVGTITVRQAFQVLSDEGLIESFRGKGTFVKAGPRAGLQNDNLRAIISDPLVEDAELRIKVLKRRTVEHLPPELQGRHIEHGPYICVRKIHFYSGVPFALMDVYVASDCYSRFPRDADARFRIPKLIALYGNGEITLNDQQISISFADEEIARLLDYTSAGALAKMLRWRTDKKDRVVWGSANYFRADLFVLDVVERSSPFSINSIRPRKRPVNGGAKRNR